jgi:hypothetical protein
MFAQARRERVDNDCIKSRHEGVARCHDNSSLQLCLLSVPRPPIRLLATGCSGSGDHRRKWRRFSPLPTPLAETLDVPQVM